MPLQCTCLGRLGSRYSLILDPIRRNVQYGSLGLMCQSEGNMKIGLQGKVGRERIEQRLPFSSSDGEEDAGDFLCVEQHQSMTSVEWIAYSVELGVELTVRITAPFWPQDEKASLVPAYLVDFTVRRSTQLVRWNRPDPRKPAKGVISFALNVPGITWRKREGTLSATYDVKARDVFGTEGPHAVWHDGHPYDNRRQHPVEGKASDAIVPLQGEHRIKRGVIEMPFDVTLDSSRAEQSFSLMLASHCGDALFERFGHAMPLKYNQWWQRVGDVVEWVKKNERKLRDKSLAFDALFADSPLPQSASQTTALAFQSYLINTLWARADERTSKPPRNLAHPKSHEWTDALAARGKPPREWFSVWEGTCWFNSTVDVTYNEAAFYFAMWPQLLEVLFEQWSHHANDHAAEQRRRARVSDDDEHGNPDVPFPGYVMEHDMGAGWSANGQSYWHAMPVEENSNFLLMLFAHARWWDRSELITRHGDVMRGLTEYLLWADSTGNGFPDRGVANTIDDANPAVQLGRDNVYLGVKRLAALHAASLMLEVNGDTKLARRCAREVKKAIKSLDAGWLDDHYPVVLDKSAKGLKDNTTGQPLPYKTLPGWDAYSLYTTNGLLYLMMVDALPGGLKLDRIATDLVAARQACRTPYGSSHSSHDPARVWISMNLWRDAVAAYLGEDPFDQCDRYWNQQAFANGPGGDKANAFTETSMTNNLVLYPRGAAAFALMFAGAGVQRHGEQTSIAPICAGSWPLLPLADWKRGIVPIAHIDGEGDATFAEATIKQLAKARRSAQARTDDRNYTTTVGE